MMLILMTMRGTPQENQAALTWTGWRFTSLDIVWVWSIPMCVKPLCTRGTRGISQTSSLLRMTSWEYSRFTEVSSFIFLLPPTVFIFEWMNSGSESVLIAFRGVIPHEEEEDQEVVN